MSGPDLIDERFDDLVRELRSGEATASPELRERVRAIAKREPTSPRRRPPASGGSGGAGSRSCSSRCGCARRGGRRRRLHLGRRDRSRRRSSASARSRADAHEPRDQPATSAHDLRAGKLPSPRAADASPLPPSGSRAQLYAVDLRPPRQRASRRRRSGRSSSRAAGAATSSTVDYGSGQKSGTAYLVLRVPIVKVQTAVAKLSALGTIADEHVSIQDVQGQLNTRFSQMQDLKATIAGLRAKLTDTSLTTSTSAPSSRRRSPAASPSSRSCRTGRRPRRPGPASPPSRSTWRRRRPRRSCRPGPARSGRPCTTSAVCSSPRRRSCSTSC